jgi:phosphomannomutase
MARKPAPKTSTKKSPAKRAGAAPKAAAAAHPSGLLVSISGIRGIAGQDLTPEVVVSFVQAFVRLIKGTRVVVGHDARPSAKWILPLVEATLRAHGVDVLFAGLSPTPTIGLLVRKLKAHGGINVTASHNPLPYNGLKFFSASGEFITKEMLQQLLAERAANPAPEAIPAIGKREDLVDPAEHHLRALLHAFPPPNRQRASKAPKVIIDCCNSTGAVLAPDVADAYGALFQLIFSDLSKYEFPREAEPTEKNIQTLCRTVVSQKADLGFAIDPDADRLAVVDENGLAIGEERTLVLATDAFLAITKKKTPIVVNLSTSRAIDDLAARHRTKVYRTAIGEANVLAGIREHKARIGGEGNGGVIVPAVQPGRDSAVAIALILMGLQSRGGTLSEWNASIPNYVMLKEKVSLGKLNVANVLSKVARTFDKARIDTTDGVKASFPDRWIHVRPSNTEPIVRLFAEAPTREAAAELIERASQAVK